MAQRVLILGAAGRDFHNFNVFFRDNADYEVVAFSAAQIPNIEGRLYPPVLSGALYPGGIPIIAEEDAARLVKQKRIDVALFGYSDVTYEHVMRLGAQVMAAGAGYLLLGPRQTMLKSTAPVIAVCAARTGAGKSQTSRRVVELLRGQELRVVAVRHPMPYGNLAEQTVQRFADPGRPGSPPCDDRRARGVRALHRAGPCDLRRCRLRSGSCVQAEEEADVIVWDGGNNDLPFYRARPVDHRASILTAPTTPSTIIRVRST